MSQGAQIFVAIFTTVLGVSATILVARLSRSQARESATIAELRSQLADSRADIVVLKAEAEEDRTHARLLADYAHKLRDHIANDKGAPPPPWPDGLTT